MRLHAATMVLLVMLVVGGCASNPPRPVTDVPVPKDPPPPPPRAHTPIDPALQESARQQLIQSAHSTEPIIRIHAVEAMQNGLGAAGEPMIVAALSDPDPGVRFAACLAAGELRFASARARLIELVNDTDPQVPVGALFALHRLGDTSRSHDLEATAKSTDKATRADTAIVLGMLGEPSAMPILDRLDRDLDPGVRIQAAEALWRLGNQRGLEELVAYTISPFGDDQMIALIALAEPHDQRVIGHIHGKLGSDEPEVALVAARGLGMLSSDGGYGIAIAGTASTDQRQRLLAALALGAIGRPDGQPALAKLLGDPVETVRVGAAMALLQLAQQ